MSTFFLKLWQRETTAVRQSLKGVDRRESDGKTSCVVRCMREVLPDQPHTMEDFDDFEAYLEVADNSQRMVSPLHVYLNII